MASKSTQKIVKLEAFKDQVKTAVTVLTRMAEERPNAGDEAVALNQDNLNQQINEQIQCDKRIVRSKPDYISAGLGPYFYKLPRELRDQIFSEILVSGYPNFMCTSRAMEQEGKSMIAKHGVFRMNLGSHDGINYKPGQNIVDKIQNVDIAIKTNILLNSVQVDQLLDLFAGHAPHRKTCNVYIEIHASGSTLFSNTASHMVVLRLRRLIGFEKVVLRTGIKWTSASAFIKPSDGCLDTSSEFKRWYTGLQQTGKFLQRYLGKTDIRSDEDGWIMVFNPRKVFEKGDIS